MSEVGCTVSLKPSVSGRFPSEPGEALATCRFRFWNSRDASRETRLHGPNRSAGLRRSPVWWMGRDLAADARRVPTGRGSEVVGLGRAPRAAVVLVDGGGVAEDRIDDPPRLLDCLLAGEEVVLAAQRRAQQTLVGRDVARGLPHRGQLDVLDCELLHARLARLHLEADHDLGLDLEAQPVAMWVLRGEQFFGWAF